MKPEAKVIDVWRVESLYRHVYIEATGFYESRDAAWEATRAPAFVKDRSQIQVVRYRAARIGDDFLIGQTPPLSQSIRLKCGRIVMLGAVGRHVEGGP